MENRKSVVKNLTFKEKWKDLNVIIVEMENGDKGDYFSKSLINDVKFSFKIGKESEYSFDGKKIKPIFNKQIPSGGFSSNSSTSTEFISNKNSGFESNSLDRNNFELNKQKAIIYQSTLKEVMSYLQMNGFESKGTNDKINEVTSLMDTIASHIIKKVYL